MDWDVSSIGDEHKSITAADALLFAFPRYLRELSGTLSVSKSADLGVDGITLRFCRFDGGAMEATVTYHSNS